MKKLTDENKITAYPVSLGIDLCKGQTNFPLLIGDQWLTEKAKQVIRFSIGDFW
ncbi:MAG: hypothetical protein HWD58_14265 [Bacteroidota bacterium]|nr:MAG: hypothetical protein HWD58_14265 [Bacteroidota bacterium]